VLGRLAVTSRVSGRIAPPWAASGLVSKTTGPHARSRLGRDQLRWYR
jgi:hypothetical protein